LTFVEFLSILADFCQFGQFWLLFFCFSYFSLLVLKELTLIFDLSSQFCFYDNYIKRCAYLKKAAQFLKF